MTLLPNGALDFDETWPNVLKFCFLLLGIGLCVKKLFVFEKTPLKQWRTTSKNIDFKHCCKLSSYFIDYKINEFRWIQF